LCDSISHPNSDGDVNDEDDEAEDEIFSSINQEGLSEGCQSNESSEDLVNRFSQTVDDFESDESIESIQSASSADDELNIVDSGSASSSLVASCSESPCLLNSFWGFRSAAIKNSKRQI
jgi:hypothetical protein